MKFSLHSLMVCAVLTACGGGGSGSTPATQNAAEQINGITVPPNPEAPAATVAGTDSNSNGARDDVERVLAARLGTKPAAYTKAVTTAKQLLAALTSKLTTSAEAIKSYVVQSTCIFGAEQEGVVTANQEMLNTRQRQQAMIEAYVAMLDVTPSGSPSISCQ